MLVLYCCTLGDHYALCKSHLYCMIMLWGIIIPCAPAAVCGRPPTNARAHRRALYHARAHRPPGGHMRRWWVATTRGSILSSHFIFHYYTLYDYHYTLYSIVTLYAIITQSCPDLHAARPDYDGAQRVMIQPRWLYDTAPLALYHTAKS